MDNTNVRILQRFPREETPPRSRLYNLPPLGVGTAFVECLTSYINRLGWAYCVSPRILMSEVIVPSLGGTHHLQSSPSSVGRFSQHEAMRMNGAGQMASNWSEALEQLTMRSDLKPLTLLLWTNGLSAYSLLREYPAWCSSCYHEWREKGLPIYQPLLWMLQVMTACPLHRKKLEELCPFCLKKQSVIAVRSRSGFCTRCNTWLGAPFDMAEGNEIDDEAFHWQKWVVGVIEELCVATASSDSILWERFPVGLAACTETRGEIAQVARRTGVSRAVLSDWRRGARTPSFKGVLELCYVLNVSPLQLLMSEPALLKEIIQARETYRQPWSREPAPPQVSREHALEMIRSVLNSQEPPVGRNWIERRLGLGPKVLARWFPQESALITARYQAYRAEQAQQRLARECDAVRQATLALYAQGMNPSAKKVRAALSDPNIMARPAVRATWRAIRRELGLDT